RDSQRDVAALFADQRAGRIVDQQPTEDFAFRRHLLRTCDETLLEAVQPACHAVVGLNNNELRPTAVDLRRAAECRLATSRRAASEADADSRQFFQGARAVTLSVT